MHPSLSLPRRAAGGLAALALATATLTACGGDSEAGSASGSSGDSQAGEGVEVRLGYFPNLTHAPAIVGQDQGFVEDSVGVIGATVKAQQFNSGTDTIEAIVSDQLDITYIGPSPALTGYSADPDKVRLIAGATSGGAALVTNPDIASVDDLAGATIATPSLGNTQDVAARYHLQEQGLETTLEGGGDVELLPQDNPITIQAYRQGEIDGGWLPEPYLSILEQDGAEVLVNEADLWPDGEFVTTHVLVNTDFLAENPEVVDAFLQAHVESVDYVNENSEQARDEVAAFLNEATGEELEPEALASAWDRLTFTNDPLASTLFANAEHAEAVGLLDPIEDIEGIYDLDPLNAILEESGAKPVSIS
ncbi:MAG: ABC transporter substrate-binding protein [Actinomycetota bacterium]|nr:ABC transporter substrate-binding protein [Actinomycetota bacterium]